MSYKFFEYEKKNNNDRNLACFSLWINVEFRSDCVHNGGIYIITLQTGHGWLKNSEKK